MLIVIVIKSILLAITIDELFYNTGDNEFTSLFIHRHVLHVIVIYCLLKINIICSICV